MIIITQVARSAMANSTPKKTFFMRNPPCDTRENGNPTIPQSRLAACQLPLHKGAFVNAAGNLPKGELRKKTPQNVLRCLETII